MAYKHKSKGSNSSNDPLPSLCVTLSSVNSSTLSLKNNDTETTKPICIPITIDKNNQRQPRRWDDSQFALELAEDDITKKIPRNNGIKHKIVSSLKKWQRKISS